jgi:hypothetical protein
MDATTVDHASSANARLPGGKIGPEYARMQPANFGKPEKVAYLPPYSPHVVPRRTQTSSQPAPPVTIALVAKSLPILFAVAKQSSYGWPDIHRIC